MARKIISELRISLSDTKPNQLYFIEKVQFDLKEHQISTGRNIFKGSPTTEEEYFHNIIDVLILSSRYSYR